MYTLLDRNGSPATYPDAGALMRLNRRDVSYPPRPPMRRTAFRRLPYRVGSRVRPLDPLGQERVEAFTAVAYRLAWQYARQWARDVPPDELIAEALYGLTYASGMFDDSRRVPFTAYATLVIRQRLTQMIRRWRRDRRFIPYPVGSSYDDTPWEAADDRPRPDLVARTSAHELCDRVRRLLPPQWYTILRLRYAEGWTYEEIGDSLGMSRQWIARIIERATRRVLRHFPTGAPLTPTAPADPGDGE